MNRKILSVLLAMVLVMGFMPAVSLPVGAAPSYGASYNTSDVAAMNDLIAAHPELGLTPDDPGGWEADGIVFWDDWSDPTTWRIIDRKSTRLNSSH